MATLKAYLFGCAVIVLLAPVPGKAQTDTLAVVGASGTAGSHGNKVQLSLMNLQEVAGVQLTLTPAHASLTMDSVRTTPRSLGMMPHWNGDNGKLILIDFSASHAIDVGFGPVLEVFYSVDAGAPSGALPLNIENVVLSDSGGNAIPVAAVDGTFVIDNR